MWYGLMKLLEMETYTLEQVQIVELALAILSINLSNNAESSYLPQITTSGNNVYVVWSDLVFVNNSDKLNYSSKEYRWWS